MTELLKVMFSIGPFVAVPILKPLLLVVRVQLVTTIFCVGSMAPYGFSLLMQIASSPASISQSEMKTFLQLVISMPFVFGEYTGLRTRIPVMDTDSQAIGRIVYPAGLVSVIPSMRRFLQ
jgi:hypothetical protein